MSKELEALKQFRNSPFQGVNVYADELLDIIETGLKVLEILKEKKVAIDELLNCIKNNDKYPALEEYNAFAGDENSLTQEEYDLLKEWLK